MKLCDVPVGAEFSYRDKFSDGWVRDYKAVKIGDTIKSWSAVMWTYVKHHQPETEEVKFEEDFQERYILWNSGIEVELSNA